MVLAHEPQPFVGATDDPTTDDPATDEPVLVEPVVDLDGGLGPVRASIVVPVYEEGAQITTSLRRILDAVTTPCEVLVVHDTEDDSTVPFARAYQEKDARVVPVLNRYGRGPARAIRYGIDAARGDVVVVTMADGCDDPAQIDPLVRLVERGVVVASASRYMPGGQQVGGPRFKGFLSRMAGLSLHWFTGVGTRDATNSFKAYDRDFLREVGIRSDAGFEIGIELVAKARRGRRPVAEVPTIWIDRVEGQSNFQLARWLPRYLRWYLFAFGRQLSSEQLHRANPGGIS